MVVKGEGRVRKREGGREEQGSRKPGRRLGRKGGREWTCVGGDVKGERGKSKAPGRKERKKGRINTAFTVPLLPFTSKILNAEEGKEKENTRIT